MRDIQNGVILTRFNKLLKNREEVTHHRKRSGVLNPNFQALTCELSHNICSLIFYEDRPQPRLSQVTGVEQ